MEAAAAVVERSKVAHAIQIRRNTPRQPYNAITSLPFQSTPSKVIISQIKTNAISRIILVPLTKFKYARINTFAIIHVVHSYYLLGSIYKKLLKGSILIRK